MGIGAFLEPTDLFLTEDIATMEYRGEKYQLIRLLPAGQPVVISVKTGRRFCLNWQRFLDEAIAAEIDKEDL